MKELKTLWSNTRMVVLVAVSSALYVALLIPFKFIQIIPGMAELRPAGSIPPLTSFLFGPAGAFGSAFGNLIGDFFGTLGPGSIFGFIGNFLYGYLPYKIYRILASEEYSWKMPVRNWLSLELAIAVSASVCAIIIGFGADLIGLAPFRVLANWITLNNLVFGLTLTPILLISVFNFIKQAGLFYNDLIPVKKPNKFSWLGLFLIIAGIAISLGLGNFPAFIESTFQISGKTLTALSVGPGVVLILIGVVLL